MWKVPLPHFPSAWIHTRSLIPNWFNFPFSWISVFLRGIHPSAIDYHFLKPLMPAFASQFLAGLAEPRGGGSEGGSQSCLRAAAASVLSMTEKQNGNYSGAWTKAEMLLVPVASWRPSAEVYRCELLCFLGEWVTVAVLKSLKCLLSIHNSIFSLFMWLLSNTNFTYTQAFANWYELSSAG